MKALERIDPTSDNFIEIIFHLQRYLSILDLVENKTILDIACGEGYGSSILSDKAKLVIGMDIDKKTIKKAKTKYLKKNLKFITGNATNLPFKENYFDVVVSFETIEHLSEHDGFKFLKEVKRVLKKNGLLILSTPNKKRTILSNYKNPYHLKEYYIDELKKILKAFFKQNFYYYQEINIGSFLLNGISSNSSLLKNLKIEKTDKNIYELSNKEISNPLYTIIISTNNKTFINNIDKIRIDSVIHEINRNYLNLIYSNLENLKKENKELKESMSKIKQHNYVLSLNLENLKKENEELNICLYRIHNAKFFKISYFLYKNTFERFKKILLKIF